MLDMTKSYLECALWSSTDSEGAELDAKYTVRDFAPEVVDKANKECSDFEESIHKALKDADYRPDWKQVGHDFWLTRNHHGTGFWDRDLGDLGDKLTDAAVAAGERNVYVGDDGLLYID